TAHRDFRLFVIDNPFAYAVVAFHFSFTDNFSFDGKVFHFGNIVFARKLLYYAWFVLTVFTVKLELANFFAMFEGAFITQLLTAFIALLPKSMPLSIGIRLIDFTLGKT